VIVMVAAPFAQVQPLVQQALQPLGTFKTESSVDQLTSLSGNWERLLMSQRPDLKSAPRQLLRDTTISSWTATQDRKDGVTERYSSYLYLNVQGMSVIFGHPATIIKILQEDTRPDPNPRSLRDSIGSLGLGNGSSSSGVSVYVVPGSVFTALNSALVTLPGQPEIASIPDAWLREADRYPIRLSPVGQWFLESR
jgi:hypothetical protein